MAVSNGKQATNSPKYWCEQLSVVDFFVQGEAAQVEDGVLTLLRVAATDCCLETSSGLG